MDIFNMEKINELEFKNEELELKNKKLEKTIFLTNIMLSEFVKKLEDVKLNQTYILFDLEATKRENSHLRKILNEQ